MSASPIENTAAMSDTTSVTQPAVATDATKAVKPARKRAPKKQQQDDSSIATYHKMELCSNCYSRNLPNHQHGTEQKLKGVDGPTKTIRKRGKRDPSLPPLKLSDAERARRGTMGKLTSALSKEFKELPEDRRKEIGTFKKYMAIKKDHWNPVRVATSATPGAKRSRAKKAAGAIVAASV